MIKILFLLVLILVSNKSYSQSDVIVSYDFNGDLTDNSDNGFDGVSEQPLAFSTVGERQVLVLDGINDYFEIPDNGSIDLSGRQSFTISAWIRVQDDSRLFESPNADFMPIVSNWNGGVSGEFFLDIRDSGNVGLLREISPFVTKTDAEIPRSEFVLVTATYDGDTSRIYINDQLESSIEIGSSRVDNSNVLVGAIYFNSQLVGHFDGEIDSLTIYSRALSDSEISDLYRIEPRLDVSLETNRVGDDVLFTVTADPEAEWTLYLGETDDHTQTERTVSSNDFDAGVAIPVEYYKSADTVEPRLSIDGREITLDSPISVSCYTDPLAYALSDLISNSDCDGDGFTNRDEITGSGAVALVGVGGDGLSAFRPDVVVEIDTIKMTGFRTAAYYESLFSDVITPFANNPDGNINLIVKASENFTQAAIATRCGEMSCPDFNILETATSAAELEALAIPLVRRAARVYRFHDDGDCQGTWGSSTIRMVFQSAGTCDSAEEYHRKHVKQVFVVNDDLADVGMILEDPVAWPESSVMFIPINTDKTDAQDIKRQEQYVVRTFMHELGHTLGLRHGGSDSYNYKPNYLSLMNYRFQLLKYTKSNPLDYSHSELATLNADAMCEGAGAFCQDGSLQALNGSVDDRYVIFTTKRSFVLPFQSSYIGYKSTSSVFDWNNNGNIDDISVKYDPPYIVARPSKLETYANEDQDERLKNLNGQMRGYDDWASLIFDPDLAQAAVSPTEEQTPGLSYEKATSILVEESGIDHDEDGIASGVDNCPTIPNNVQADSDNDGVGDVCDLCPTISSTAHIDLDRDGIGDACDTVIGSTPIDISNDEWVQIGTPVATLAQGLGKIMGGALDAAGYGVEWVVYDYDAMINDYIEISPGDRLESGVGYWLKQVTGRMVTVKAPIWLRQPMSAESADCHDEIPCVVTKITEIASARATNWLMIANPFDRATSVSDIFVSLQQNGSTKIFSPEEGNVEETEFTNGIFVYNESINDYDFLGPEQMLEPWQAGWFGYRAVEGSAASTYVGFSDRP